MTFNTFVVLTTNIINTQSPAAWSVDSDESLTIISGVTVVSEFGYSGINSVSASAPSNGSLEIDGYLIGSRGVDLAYNAGVETIGVGPTGSVLGQYDAIRLQNTSTSAPQAPPMALITNNGYISGYDDGIQILSMAESINNSGTISGGDDAILATAAHQLLVNSGKIIATHPSSVVELGGYSRVVNSGSITGAFAGVKFDGGDDVLDNSGTIAVTGGDGVNMNGNGLSLVNSGKISAYTDAIYGSVFVLGVSILNQLGGAVTAVTNAVDLGGGASLTNYGAIAAGGGVAVYAGGGADDAIVNGATGSISGQIAIDGAGVGLSLVNHGSIHGAGTTHVIGQTGGGAKIVSSGAIAGVTKALDLTGGLDYIVNSGQIAVTGAYAISADGGQLRLHNSGRISAASNTIDITSGGPANHIVNQIDGVIAASGLNDDIIDTFGQMQVANYGEIDGVVVLGRYSGVNNVGKLNGQVAFTGISNVLRNSGDIAYDGGVAAVEFAGGAGSTDRLVNTATGVIYAAYGDAVSYGGSGTFTLVNHGEILGGVTLGAAGAVLGNTGAITGAVALSGGSGLVVNQGLLDGDLTFGGTGNVYRGQQGKVSGTIYGTGADGRYYGGSGAEIFDLTANGAAFAYGGAGDDTFLFTATGLTAGTVVNGGDGADAITFTTPGSMHADIFAHVSGVETYNLANGTNNLSIAEKMVASAGGALTVNGGTGADTINASGVVTPADKVTIYGGVGADQLTAGGGADVFGYRSVADSYALRYDTIAGLDFSNDRLDVSAAAKSILAVNTAVTSGALSTATINADLAAALPVAALGAHDAVLFTASSGALAGATFLVVDVNGVAGYQANADLVIRLNGAKGALTTADFI